MDDLVLDDLPVLGPVFARALATHVRPRGARAGSRADTSLPERAATVTSHRQDAERLARYARVCGFTLRDRVPPTWLHVLTFPLQAVLMAERDFPFGLAGLVHAGNTMTLHRPVALGDDLGLGVHAANVRAHRRGALFDMVGRVHVDGALAWEGTSTYLATVPGGPGGPQPPASDPAAPGLPAPSQQWRLAPGLGRAYAGVSGDVNPIHLYPLTARPFGFRRPIVHGMWTHARALAALEGRLPETYSVDVRFTRPIALPGTVGFAAAASAGGLRFGVLGRDGTVHLTGATR